MIRETSKIEEACCDSCGRNLLQKVEQGYENCNFGLLQNSFGYPSRLDNIMESETEFHLCEDCWERVMKLLGLWKKHRA